MRIKCKYKGKVILKKKDEIIIEEELPFNEEYEPKDYIENYLKSHKIDNLDNIQVDFEFDPLVNDDWTFIDINEGDFYIMPNFVNNSHNNNIEIYKNLYIVEKITEALYVNPYRASYIFNKFKHISFLIFYNYNYNLNKYEEILVLSMPIDKAMSESDIDEKILQFCNLVSSKNNKKEIIVYE